MTVSSVLQGTGRPIAPSRACTCELPNSGRSRGKSALFRVFSNLHVSRRPLNLDELGNRSFTEKQKWKLTIYLEKVNISLRVRGYPTASL